LVEEKKLEDLVINNIILLTCFIQKKNQSIIQHHSDFPYF